MAHTDIATIDKEAVQKKISKGDVQIVNVLSPEYYSMGFIPGSLKIPLDELDDRASELHKSKEVIVYCAGVQCDASRHAAQQLSERGFNVKAYEGGIKEWKEAGYPIEGEK